MDDQFDSSASSSSSSSSLLSYLPRTLTRRLSTKLSEKSPLSSRSRCGKCSFVRLFFVFVLIVLICFRGHFFCFVGFLHCYLTWPFSSPAHVQLNLTNFSSPSPSEQFIPRRLHHIVLGPMSRSIPDSWQRARNACTELHPNFDHFYFWSDENSDEFLRTHYPWFVGTWHSYETFVQKADSLRYFVLYHYGGIFLDMDLSCRVSLNPLLNYLDGRATDTEAMFFAVKAFPVGISNGFMISTVRHPLLERVMKNLEIYHRSFLLPHATIIISTGPMCISIQIQWNRPMWRSILVLDGKENMLGGKRHTPLFDHLGSGSWHQADDLFFKNIPQEIQQQTQTFSISIIFLFTIVSMLFLLKNKLLIKNFLHRLIFN